MNPEHDERRTTTVLLVGLLLGCVCTVTVILVVAGVVRVVT